MRIIGISAFVLTIVSVAISAQKAADPAGPAQPAAPSTPAPMQVIGTMSELMVDIIYPTSDAVFYITSRTPKTDAEWQTLQGQTLMLAESANLLLMPARARGREQWIKDARLMLDAGTAAFKAAKAKDLPALEALSDQLYESCVTCHKNFRPNYGKPKPPGN